MLKKVYKNVFWLDFTAKYFFQIFFYLIQRRKRLMKIENTILPKRNFIPNFKAKITNLDDYKNRNKERLNSDCYCAQNLKQPRSVNFYSCENGETYNIKLDEETTFDYLVDEDGNINNKLVQDFVKYFNITMKYLNSSQNEKEIRKQNKLDMLSKYCFDFLFNVITNPKMEQKTPLSLKAVEMTVNFFQLSEIEHGKYDFSDYKNKINLIEAINSINMENIEVEDEQELYQEIKNSGRNEDGTYDYKLIYDALGLISSSAFAQSPSQMIDLLKHLYSYDKDKTFTILGYLERFNETYFHLDTNSNNLERLMGLCFNEDKKFDTHRADKVKEAIDIAENWLCINMEEIESEEGREVNLFDRCLDAATDIISSGFCEFENNPDLNIEDYVSKGLDKLIFI